MVKKKKLKLGLALGGGSAKGWAHIGVLQVLHKYKIYPDYLAGSSMGSIITATYAAGHSPQEMEDIAKSVDWKDIIDFAIPKSGLIKGHDLEKYLRKLVRYRKFSNLDLSLRIVAYNLDLNEPVVFSKGDVARALRASISLPGIFTPVKIGEYNYVDGGLANPTPFDVVRKMGANLIIAVDLSAKEKTVYGPKVTKKSFLEEMRQKFIAEELLNLKNYLIPLRWPVLIQKFLKWLFDKLLYPAKVLRIMTGMESPPIAKVMYSTMNILLNNLSKERINKAKIDLVVTPSFSKISWMDFDQPEYFIREGAKAMEKQIPALKKLLRKKKYCSG
jgi:NTE family protein